jgi:alpha-tubulin suppressor-like RCC1 family protein
MQSLAYCWGGNFWGEVGDNSNAPKASPTLNASGLNFVTVSPGRYFSCGVTTTGAGYCWGVNDLGELGDGTLTSSKSSPTLVATAQKFSVISAGGFHACGLTVPDGLAYCWGWNALGQLGSGSTTSSRTPVLVSPSLKFIQISAGNRHTCGVTASGQAYCWGDGSTGMIGDNLSLSRSVPTLVAGGVQFKSVSAGRFHTCGLSTDGIVYCWGNNSGGALGDGTSVSRAMPVPAG